MPRHIQRLLLILAASAIAAIFAKAYFTVDSFGLFGHYRADSVEEIAAQQPKYQGVAYCRQCHLQRVAFWSQGKHQGVKCEICHTAAAGHPTRRKLPVPADTVSLCGSCHEAMPSRPAASIKQVVITSHMGDQACIECHTPHSPTHFTWDDIQGALTDPEPLHG